MAIGSEQRVRVQAIVSPVSENDQSFLMKSFAGKEGHVRFTDCANFMKKDTLGVVFSPDSVAKVTALNTDGKGDCGSVSLFGAQPGEGQLIFKTQMGMYIMLNLI